MKNVLYTSVAVCLILFMSACSTKTTRMMVSQIGSNEVLAIDLESPPVINAMTVPFPTPLPSHDRFEVNIHSWGNIGFVTRVPITYKLNLNTGQIISSQGDPISGYHKVVPVPNGLFLILASLYGNAANVSLYDIVNSEVISETTFGSRGNIRSIIDIAVCDDNKTVLVTNFVGRKNYVSKLIITTTGQLINAGGELASTDIHQFEQVACAPTSKTGAVLDGIGNNVVSFTINDDMDGLTQVDVTSAAVNDGSGTGIIIPQALIFNPDGSELFVRLSSGGSLISPNGWIEKFSFDKNLGRMQPTPGWLANAPHIPYKNEAARLSIHPNGDYLYVPDESTGEILVIRTSNGSHANPITDTRITAPAYLSIGKVICVDLNNAGCQ